MFTWCSRLLERLVNVGAEAAADGDVVGGAGRLPTLVPQLFLSPPLRSSVGEPNLHMQKEPLLLGSPPCQFSVEQC